MTLKVFAKAAEPMRNGPGTLRKTGTKLFAKAVATKFMKPADIAMSAERKMSMHLKKASITAPIAETLLKTGFVQTVEKEKRIS